MYLSYYNLESKPFQMSTDPGFLWLGEKHKEALATLKYAILENKGILALTGDVGTGKTTLINALIQTLGDDTLAATIYDPSLGVLEFFNIISAGFNMERTFDGKAEFLITFKQFLKKVRAQNKKVLLIIDEAQRISNELLEEIRLLSNLEDEYVRLLNIFFVGQDEFIDILKDYKNRALRQRVTLRYHIEPLTLHETEAYIRHRLEIAGAKTHIFSSGAIHEIFSFSSGYPRLINIICDHALLSGYVRDSLIITPDIVKECKEELQVSNLNRGCDTDDSHDEIESKQKSYDTRQLADNSGDESALKDNIYDIHDIQKDADNSVQKSESTPKISIIQPEEIPRHKKIRDWPGIATRILLLVVVGLFAGYVFYGPVKTRTTPSSSQGLMERKTDDPGQIKEKNDLGTTVPSALIKKAYQVPDTVEPGKKEGSQYYKVGDSEPKPVKEIYKIESKTPESTPPKPNPVTTEKKKLEKDLAKPKILVKKDLSLQKDRVIVPKVNKIASMPSEKQEPRKIAKSFETLQKPSAAGVSKKDKPPVKTSAISKSPTAGVSAVAKAPEQKEASGSRKGIESQASIGSNLMPEDLQSRLNIFLNKYCRTYEKEQLNQFATFFTPDAMEKGESFTSRLDQYRRTFESVDSMNYRIELKRYAIQKGTGAIRIEGIFHARARLVESKKWLENSGPIAMELVANGDSFKVRRLEY